MNHILPLAKSQMGKHNRGSTQVYKVTDRQQHVYQPALSSPMLMLYRTSDAEEIKYAVRKSQEVL